MKNLSLIFIIVLAILIPLKNAVSNENLEAVETYILREDYAQAIRAAREILPLLSSADVPHAEFLLGCAYLKTNQPQRARKHFQLALKKTRDKNLIQKAKIAICDSYYLEGEFKKAASGYTKFLRKYKKTDYKEIVKFKLAKSYLKQGEWKKAKKLLKDVAQSSSIESKSAEKILRENQFYFTIQVGSFQSRKNAYNLQKRLKKDKFDCYITEIQHHNLTFYRVRIGKLRTRKQAQKLLTQLKKKSLPAKICP